MPKLTEITTNDDVMHSFSWDGLWALFDGDRDCMNLAHECIDRHRDQGTAISVKFADGHSEHYDYAVLAELSGRFANWLPTIGIAKGDRVAIVLDPGKAFYVSLFGTIKRGAITGQYASDDGKKYVEFALVAENQDGDLSARGTAVAQLPSRAG